ncbi:MAG TPA: type IV pilin protein [Noviherbaspirillum sp.]
MSSRQQHSSATSRGFTLIELMVAVSIVAILAAIAYPSYADYVLRSRLVDPVNTLSAMRASMEQYYQDNRTYSNASSTIVSPCDSTKLPTLKDFTISCAVAATGDSYTITATGISGHATDGFVYSVANTDTKGSTVSSAWGGGTYSCWIMKRGDTC